MNVVSIPSALRCEHGSLHLDAQPLFTMSSVVADGVTSQNFRDWSAEASYDWLLGSAKSGHTEPSDWSAAKKTDDTGRGKGWSCWILSMWWNSQPQHLSRRSCPGWRRPHMHRKAPPPYSRDTPRGGLWIICQNQNQKTHASLSYSMQFWGYWQFMQNRQRIFNSTGL